MFDVAVDFGGDPTGAADCVGCIAAARDAAIEAGGGIVYLAPGTWSVKSAAGIQLASNVHYQAADGAVIRQDFWQNQRAMVRSGSASNVGQTNEPLTADAPIGAIQINISALASLKAGDWYFLVGDDDRSASPELVAAPGEMIQVVSALGGTVTLYSPLRDTYRAAGNARIRGPIAFIDDCSISGGRWINGDPYNNHQGKLIEAYYLRRFRFENLDLVGADYASMEILHCRDGVLDNISVRENSNPFASNGQPFFNAAGASAAPGYGIEVHGMSERIVAYSPKGQYVTHCFDTSSGTNAVALNPVDLGWPRDILVIGGMADSTFDCAFNTHVGDGVTYMGCRAERPGLSGFRARARNMKIVGCAVKDGQSTDPAVTIDRGSDGCEVDGLHVSNCNSAVVLRGASRAVVHNCVFDHIRSNAAITTTALGATPMPEIDVYDNVIRNIGTANGPGDKYGINISVATDGIRIRNNLIEQIATQDQPYPAGPRPIAAAVFVSAVDGRAVVEGNRSVGAAYCVAGTAAALAATRVLDNLMFDDPNCGFVKSEDSTYVPKAPVTATTVQGALDQLATMVAPSLGHYGDGSDGNVTISADTTLTRDMFYNSLTVNAGVVLRTGGFRIFARTSITLLGTIQHNGGNASSSAVGAGAVAGSLDGGGAGGTGGASPSGAGTAGAAVSPSYGGDGGAGSNGGVAGGPAGGGASDPTPAMGSIRRLPNMIEGRLSGLGGSAFLRGGAGGGGSKASLTAAGGRGGGGGGVIVVATATLVHNGVIEARGGSGSSVGTANGGGGGGGGTILLVFRTKTGSGTNNVSGGNGASGGGSPGSPGRVFELTD